MVEQLEIQMYCQRLILLKEDFNEQQTKLQCSYTELQNVYSEIEVLSDEGTASKEIVFPLFDNLTQIYIQARSAYILLDNLIEVAFEIADSLNKHTEKLSEVTEEEGESEMELELDTKHYTLINKEDADFMLLPISFSGICPVSLAEQKVIRFGNPVFGILDDLDQQLKLVFVTPRELFQYVKYSKEIVSVINDLQKDSLVLNYLLHPEKKEKIGLFNFSIKQALEDSKDLQFHVGVQTPVHILEPRIVESYYWNEWDLRRQALKMANIRKKKTIACQTINSCFKIDCDTQILPLFDKTTMTGVENGTNPIWPRNYIVGLRENIMISEEQ